MSWLTTWRGTDHHLSGLAALLNVPHIHDIAHSLAQLNRFTGHCRRPYSVAEHSLLCADLARHDGKSAVIQLACLMHDAHEAYTGDCSSPVKVAVGLSWSSFEHPQADVVRRTFGLTVAFQAHRDLVHHYDLVALATERRDLTTYRAGFNAPWAVVDTPGAEVPPASFVNLNAMDHTKATWTDWRGHFLGRFLSLQAEIRTAAPTTTTP